jgi:hypothetical protein
MTLPLRCEWGVFNGEPATTALGEAARFHWDTGEPAEVPRTIGWNRPFHGETTGWPAFENQGGPFCVEPISWGVRVEKTNEQDTIGYRF